MDRADAAGRAGEDDVAGQEREVGGDVADDFEAVEDELIGVRVLAEPSVLKELDVEAVRVEFGLDVWAERGEGVEGLGARPLALGVLDGAVADVLRAGVAEDVTRCGGGRDVADFSTDDDAEFGFEVGAMLLERDFNLAAVRQQRGGGFEPEQRFFRQRFVLLARVVGVVEADANNFGRRDGRESFETFGIERLFFERRRAKEIADQTEKFAINNLGVKNLLTSLKSAYGSHKTRLLVTEQPTLPQGETSRRLYGG